MKANANISKVKEIISKVPSSYALVAAIVVFAIIVVVGIIYISSILSGNGNKQCKIIDQIYQKNTTIQPITNNKPFNDAPVNYFYIKTAFNCCSVGNYVDNYVNTCILSQIIAQGVRCLDVQIFNLNGVPVISTSNIPFVNSDSTYIKETYNYVLFSTAMEIVVNEGLLNSSTCNNHTDPMFINLRMFTKNTSVFNTVATILANYKNRFLLRNEYNEANQTEFFKTVILSDLMNKMIIMVNSDLSVLSTTNLYQYTNVISGPSTPYFWTLTYNDLQMEDSTDVIDFTALKMAMVIPSQTDGVPQNPNPIESCGLGIQFIGMAYQVFDNYLIASEDKFDQSGYAFVMKPRSLLPQISQVTWEAIPSSNTPWTCKQYGGAWSLGSGCSGATMP